MASPAPAERLRRIAEDIRCLPKAYAMFSAYESEVARRAEALLYEAIELGAFGAAEHELLRALVARQKTFEREFPDDWQSGVWAEATTGLHSLLPEYRRSDPTVWPKACGPIADLLEAEADKSPADTRISQMSEAGLMLRDCRNAPYVTLT